MSRIAAAVFADRSSADQALRALSGLGVGAADVEAFFVESPGGHDRLPMDGDEGEESDARAGDPLDRFRPLALRQHVDAAGSKPGMM